MKKLILSLTAVLLALTLAACATEELPALKGVEPQANDAHLDGDAGADVAVITVNDPEAPQSGGEWEEWVCVTERPYDENETATDVSTSDPAPADPVNTAPADLNEPLPTLTLTDCTNGTAEFSVQNNTQYEWGYGLEPYFDKYDYEQGVWLPVDPITDIAYIEIYCLLQPGDTTTYTIPVQQYYGELPTGIYRAGLHMRNQSTETSEMIWGGLSIGIIECY